MHHISGLLNPTQNLNLCKYSSHVWLGTTTVMVAPNLWQEWKVRGLLVWENDEIKLFYGSAKKHCYWNQFRAVERTQNEEPEDQEAKNPITKVRRTPRAEVWIQCSYSRSSYPWLPASRRLHHVNAPFSRGYSFRKLIETKNYNSTAAACTKTLFLRESIILFSLFCSSRKKEKTWTGDRNCSNWRMTNCEKLWRKSTS